MKETFHFCHVGPTVNTTSLSIINFSKTQMVLRDLNT